MRKKIILAAIGAIIMIFIVPILINECYKAETIYVTKWEAADVLSYYGTLLGALVTVVALVTTIQFTKRQIQRENFIKTKREKWDRIESLFFKALEDIHPTRLSEIIAQFNPEDAYGSQTACSLYIFRAKTATDSIYSYVNEEDYKLVGTLYEQLQLSIERYCAVARGMADQYDKMVQLTLRREIEAALKKRTNNIRYNLDQELEFQKILHATQGITEDAITKKITSFSEQLVEFHDSDYRNLVELKRNTFTEIYNNIDREADEILRLWRKKNADT